MDIREQIGELILDGERIIKTVGNRGLYGNYYTGEEYEKWISKCIIIMDKYFKESNLYAKFIEASKSAVGNGKEYYDTMIGVLKAINEVENADFLKLDSIKKKKIFISHSSKNKKITDKFVELLRDMGVKNEQIYYSSYEETGVNFLQDCFQRIKEEFNENELLVIFMISREFYSSKICIAEMGATWVTTANKYIPIIIPPYSYSNVEGVINTTQAGIALNDTSINAKIEKLKEDIELFLEIENKTNAIEWNRKKDEFLRYINVLESDVDEIEGKLLDIRLENKHSETHIMFKIGLVNNTRSRMKLEEVNINLKIDGEQEENISLSDWNVQALAIQPLEEITVYLPITIEKIVKRSKVKVKESIISMSYYEEN